MRTCRNRAPPRRGTLRRREAQATHLSAGAEATRKAAQRVAHKRRHSGRGSAGPAAAAAACVSRQPAARRLCVRQSRARAATHFEASNSLCARLSSSTSCLAAACAAVVSDCQGHSARAATRLALRSLHRCQLPEDVEHSSVDGQRRGAASASRSTIRAHRRGPLPGPAEGNAAAAAGGGRLPSASRNARGEERARVGGARAVPLALDPSISQGACVRQGARVLSRSRSALVTPGDRRRQATGVMSADGADAGAPNLASLFSTLEDALRSFSLHKALHACDQILAVAPADEDALRAKVAVCIHSESFEAALALLSAHPDLAARLPFEKAYCLYRASRHKEALELLRDAEADIPAEHAAGALQLRAQLQYRAGAFDECIRTYETALEVRRRARAAPRDRLGH